MTAKNSNSNSLELLTALERGEVVTQGALSKRLGVAVGLINALLRRAMQKGLVKARQAPYKRYAYYLTPKGFAEKSRLVGEYLESSLQFFRLARQEYAEIFHRVERDRQPRLVLYGDGELAEIAVLAASAEGVVLLAIVDPKANLEKRHGVRVVNSLAEVENPAGVILTAAQQPQAVFDALRAEYPTLPVYAPGFLRVLEAQADLPDETITNNPEKAA